MFDNFLNEIGKCNLSQLRQIQTEVEKQRKAIINNGWEEHYKMKCGARYLPLADVFMSIDLSNLLCGQKLSELRDLCYKSNDLISISEIIEKSTHLGLEIGGKFAQMICSACVCKGCYVCSDGVHCNGYACKSCKENNYKGYDWSCEE